MTTGSKPIGETKITSRKRSGALPGLCAALKEVFITQSGMKGFLKYRNPGLQKGRSTPVDHGSMAGIRIVAGTVVTEHQLR